MLFQTVIKIYHHNIIKTQTYSLSFMLYLKMPANDDIKTLFEKKCLEFE